MIEWRIIFPCHDLPSHVIHHPRSQFDVVSTWCMIPFGILKLVSLCLQEAEGDKNTNIDQKVTEIQIITGVSQYNCPNSKPIIFTPNTALRMS